LLPDGIETARKRVVSDVLLQERLRLKLLELGLLGAPRMWG
jgi:Fe2+ transport system protein FeoA